MSPVGKKKFLSDFGLVSILDIYYISKKFLLTMVKNNFHKQCWETNIENDVYKQTKDVCYWCKDFLRLLNPKCNSFVFGIRPESVI